MKKKDKKSPKPRYITIRIRYYPIPAGVLIAPFVLIVLSMFFLINGLWEKESRIKNQELRIISTKSVIHDSLFMIQFLQNLNKHSFYDNQIVFHGDRGKKEIALTFDADMTLGMESQLASGEVESYYNKSVIDILNKTRTKATLFLTGMWIEMYPDEAKSFSFNPFFELANHSYSHPSFDGYCFGLYEISDYQDDFELQKTQYLLKKIAGVDNKFFRFPGGCYSQKDLDIVRDNKLMAIQWDVIGNDGFNYDTQSIIDKVINGTQNGSIIVLHMHGGPNAPMTAEALLEIIKILKERGFIFVKISELLNVNNSYKFTTNIN